MIIDDQDDFLPAYSYRNTQSSAFEEDQPELRWPSYSPSATSGTVSHTNDETHYSATALLSQMQCLGVDMLHTAWTPASLVLDRRGDVSVVSQVGLNPTVALAFKRYRRDTDVASERRMYRAVISEVLVLQSSILREHSNIIDLKGICWEVDDTVGDDVLVNPVLVFERPQCGTLADWVVLPIKRKLKQWYCMIEAILGALSALHSCGLIHGDIKPTSILVFLDDVGAPVPKLADFGFSTIGLRDHIHLPISRGWTAPELNTSAQSFNMTQVQKMDVFSSGLLVLWILTQQHLSTSSSSVHAALRNSATKLKYIQSSADWSVRVDQAKAEGSFDPWIEGLLTSIFAPARVKEAIGNTLRLALKIDFAERARHCGHLLNVLNRRPDTSSMIGENILDSPFVTRDLCQELNAVAVIFGLARCDFRVRRNLIRDLQTQVHAQSCLSCMRPAAFALAVCAALGYGMSLDRDLAQSYLEYSQSTMSNLQTTMDVIANEATTWPPINCGIEDDYDRELVPAIDMMTTYKRASNVSKMMAGFEYEIANIEGTLGSVNRVTLGLKTSLVYLLKQAGALRQAETITQGCIEALEQTHRLINGGNRILARWRMLLVALYIDAGRHSEALTIQKVAVDTLASELGSRHIETLHGMRLLSHCYALLWPTYEAESFARDVIDLQGSVFGEWNMAITEALWQLGHCLELQDNYKGARTLYRQAIDIRHNALGKLHPDSQGIRLSLISVDIKLCNFGAAELQALEMKEAEELNLVHGMNVSTSYYTILGLLALLHRDRQEYAEAERYAVEAIKFAFGAFGADSKVHLDALEMQASICDRNVSVHQAINPWSDIAQKSMAVLGPAHPQTLFRRIRLGSLYNRVRQYGDAELVLRQVLEEMRKFNSDDITYRPSCLAGLAVALTGQGKYTEAVHTYKEIINLASATRIKEWDEVLSNIDSLAIDLNALGEGLLNNSDLRAAENKFRECLELRLQLTGQEQRDAVHVMENLATTLRKLGDPGSNEFKECVELQEKVVRTRRIRRGETHPLTISALKDLTHSYMLLDSKADEDMMDYQPGLDDNRLEVDNDPIGRCVDFLLQDISQPTENHLSADEPDRVSFDLVEEPEQQMQEDPHPRRKRKNIDEEPTSRSIRPRFA